MPRDQQFMPVAQSTESVLSALPDVVLVLDTMARINFASVGSDEFLGSRPRDWIGLSVLDQVHPDDAPAVVERLDLARSGMTTPTTALRIRVSAGVDRWGVVAAHGFVQIETDGLTGTLVMFRDVTGQLTQESAKQDALQSVFNPTASPDDLQVEDQIFVATELLQALLSDNTSSAPGAAIIVMTLSDHGNEAGAQAPDIDNPIVDLAYRVREILRPGDALSRLGESQLVIMCGGLTDPADGLEIARRLHKWCSPSPLRDVDDACFELTTGFALASEGDDAIDVLKHAASEAGTIESAAFVATAA